MSDDYRILVAEKVPEQARRFLNPDGKAIVPESALYRPNPFYLKFHRDSVFKR